MSDATDEEEPVTVDLSAVPRTTDGRPRWDAMRPEHFGANPMRPFGIDPTTDQLGTLDLHDAGLF